MKFTWFHLMPYRYLPEDFKDKYRSVWVDIPQNLYDPKVGHKLYNDYLDQLEFADRMGFDGARHQRASSERVRDDAVAEHHGGRAVAPHPQRQHRRAGQLDRAVQSADSRRRGIRDARRDFGRTPGRGVPGRHLDGHQLLLRRNSRHTAREVLRGARSDHEGVEGKGDVLLQRQVHQAALRQPVAASPIQQPHPPIWIPGGGSVETWDFCAPYDYTTASFPTSGTSRAKKSPTAIGT